MNIYEKELDDDTFEEQLNEVYGNVDICGYSFPAGQALRELDPTAFDCGIADRPPIFCCGECNIEFEEPEEAETCCKEEE